MTKKRKTDENSIFFFLLRDKCLTCRNDLINARRLLFPYHVPTPAGQGAVIPFGFGSIDELAHGAIVTVESGRCDLEVLAAVVELPDKIHLAGVSVDLAAHLHRLLQGSPDNRYLLQLANRRDWSRITRGKKKKKNEDDSYIFSGKERNKIIERRNNFIFRYRSAELRRREGLYRV